MERKRIRVSIADYKIGAANSYLVSYGLGSCVGIAMFQPGIAIGGLAHILLPRRGDQASTENPFKFADITLSLMCADLISHGLSRERLCSKIAGGASMFTSRRADEKVSIGQRNVEAVLEILEGLHIPVVGRDTGGHFGRTLEFDPVNSDLAVRSLHGGDRIV